MPWKGGKWEAGTFRSQAAFLAAARKKRDLSASFYFVIRFARSSLTRSVGISSLS